MAEIKHTPKSGLAIALWTFAFIVAAGLLLKSCIDAGDVREQARQAKAEAERARVEQFKADHHCRVTGLTWFRQKWTCDHGYTYEEKL